MSDVNEINNVMVDFGFDKPFKAITQYPIEITLYRLLTKEEEVLLLKSTRESIEKNMSKYNMKYKFFKQNERIIDSI